MTFTSDQKKSYERAAALCARSEHSVSDIRKKLKSWKVPEEEREPVLAKLVEDGFLDDLRFARAYARDKSRFNGWGRKKISYMLRIKGISDEILEQALEEIDPATAAAKLHKMLTERARKVRGEDRFEKRQKLLRFAMSRGYDFSEIVAVLDEIGF